MSVTTLTRRATVTILVRTCSILDRIGWPQHFEGRWYWAPQGLGCRLGLSTKSINLDDRWQTGVWA